MNGIEIGYHLSRDENVIGTSQHFLYIGRKLIKVHCPTLFGNINI